MSATITAPVMAGKGVPIFDGTDFTTWKLKLLWYLGSIHDEMERVLTEGPIIPDKWTEEVSIVDGTVVKPAEFIQTPRTQWTEQDAILYRFDSKIRSIISNAISVPILRKVGHAKIAKAMWDILLNDFEGVTMESLFDLHSRFQVLINDLEGAGVIKTQAELCQTFVDALPETFEFIITSMVVSERLDNYDLSGLFGILTNFEETKLKKKINAKKIAKDPDAALVATTKRNKELFSSYSTKAETDEESDDSSEDEEVQMLEEQMALLTQRIEKKKFGPRKGKSPFDPKKATCFKCGKVGHIVAECWSKKYKQKYKNLKKEGVKPVVKKAEKALYTETWDDEDSSSDEEEDKCLMAVIEQEKSSSQFEADLKIAEKLNSQSNIDKSTAYKVQNFVHYVDNEKISMFQYLLNDFKSCLDENKRLKSELDNLKAIIREKDLHISETEQCRIKLVAYISSFNKEIIRFDDEKRKIRERADNYEKIYKSWCVSSKKNSDAIARQIPAYIKAVLGVGFDLKNDTGVEKEKDPNIFKPVILHNTFLKVDGDNQYLTNAFVMPELGFIYSTETISGSGNTDSNSESGSSDSDIDSVKQSDTVISEITHDDSKSEKQKCFEVKAITKLKKRISKLCKNLKDKPKVKNELDKPKSLGKVDKWIKLDKQWSNIQNQCKEKIIWIKTKPFVWRNERKWFLDSGCSRHMTGCKEHLEGFVEEKGPSIRYGDNSVGKTIGYGFVKAGGVTLKRVALVEGLMHNLLSVSQVADEECEIRIRKNAGIIYDPKGKPILVAWRQQNVYVVDLDATDYGIDTCLYSQIVPELNWLWHRRLSHLYFKNINELSKKKLVRGLPQLSYKKDKVCSACVNGKQTKAHFHSKTLATINEPLHMLHMNLFGPMNIGSLSGKKYTAYEHWKSEWKEVYPGDC
ncbi:uncharacterized protein [Rutidosis leptorrhynchoides]|uniref:uncharacterized protein n=1 Tax=Rutidosis leptorrhynchoides TaxID=125765 RepID=UPI003A99767A